MNPAGDRREDSPARQADRVLCCPEDLTSSRRARNLPKEGRLEHAAPKRSEALNQVRGVGGKAGKPPTERHPWRPLLAGGALLHRCPCSPEVPSDEGREHRKDGPAATRCATEEPDGDDEPSFSGIRGPESPFTKTVCVDVLAAAVQARPHHGPVAIRVGEPLVVGLKIQNVLGDHGPALDTSGLIGPDETNWGWRRRHGGVPFLLDTKKENTYLLCLHFVNTEPLGAHPAPNSPRNNGPAPSGIPRAIRGTDGLQAPHSSRCSTLDGPQCAPNPRRADSPRVRMGAWRTSVFSR
jgi:hypothetical protein